MNISEYQEEMIKFLNDDYDLSRTEAKQAYTYLIIERIFTSLTKTLSEDCNSCTYFDLDAGVYSSHCASCKRYCHDFYESKSKQ